MVCAQLRCKASAGSRPPGPLTRASPHGLLHGGGDRYGWAVWLQQSHAVAPEVIQLQCGGHRLCQPAQVPRNGSKACSNAAPRLVE